MAVTKVHIKNPVSKHLGLPKTKSGQVVESLLEITKKTLENGEDVLITGFGKFCVKSKRERRGRNPQTGQDLMLGERREVVFRCSKRLKYGINGEGWVSGWKWGLKGCA